ncbi:MAG: HlyD family efflux transporter periplasmic adaptor subunit [Ectothiorhodospiraceae bacterium]|nr:HlyD family efflux transporter periplasmic adaptor subunit [Ectothiorhodospiraceae bacterium]
MSEPARAPDPTSAQAGAQPIELGSLHARARSLLDRPPETRLAGVLELLVGLTNAAGAVAYLRADGGGLAARSALLSRQLRALDHDFVAELQVVAERACAEDRAAVATSRYHATMRLVAVPLVGDAPDAGGALGLVLVLERGPIEPLVTALGLVAALPLLPDAATAPGPRRTESWLDVVGAVLAAPDRDAAWHTAAGHLARLTGASTAALGRRDRGAIRLVAVSGVVEHDRASSVNRRLETAMETAWRASAPIVHPAGDETLARVAASLGAGAAVAQPLRTATGDAVAALALVWDDPASGHAGMPTLRPEVGPGSLDPALEHALAAALDVAGSGRHRHSRRIVRATIVSALALGSLAALLVPVEHAVEADVVLEARERRFVPAPVSAVLAESPVRPGDIVRAGDRLAVLDGREVALELAEVVAERDRALKRRDVSLASRDTAGAQMAELEARRLAARERLLAYRAASLEIVSPIDGLVVQGDLRREIGAPVELGTRLFEIAPVDPMVAEIAVPASAVGEVAVGAVTRLRLDAFPDRSWSAPVLRLHPRSTIRGGENVFLAEVEIANPDRALRPGMGGRAAIAAGRRALGWVWLHRAWERVERWLLW